MNTVLPDCRQVQRRRAIIELILLPPRRLPLLTLDGCVEHESATGTYAWLLEGEG